MVKIKNLFKYIKEFTFASRFYIYNHLVTRIPIYAIRHFYLRFFLKIKIGKGTSVHMGCFFTGNNIQIGNNCVLNRRIYFDGRGKIIIGDNTSISPECYLLSLGHDVNDDHFGVFAKTLQIDDHAWIGARVIILPGVHLIAGTVVGAGSVVTKSTSIINQIIGGVLAKVIGQRKINKYDYTLSYFPWFDTDVA